MLAKDRAAIVAGAGLGLGAAVAEELSREGAKVTLRDVDLPVAEEVAAGIRAAGRKAFTFDNDVGKPVEAEALVPATLETYGRVDILINNAAI